MQATQEVSNNKEADNAKRRFILCAGNPVDADNAKELILHFEFRAPTDQEKKAVKDSEATRILKEALCLFKKLADILLEVETLDGEEFEIIVECSLKKEAASIKHPEESCSTCTVKENCTQPQNQREADAITA